MKNRIKLTMSIFLILIILNSCKSQKACDAYSQTLINQIDSLKAELYITKDSLQLYDDYINLLETDNQLLGSALAETIN